MAVPTVTAPGAKVTPATPCSRNHPARRHSLATTPRPPREVRIVGHQHAACKRGGAASSFSPFTISVIWRSWPSVSPWRRQMAECDRSIGRGAFAQGGEDGNCGQLARLPRQQVALEDVAEQVFVQVPINDGGQRRHSPSWAHRQGRRSAFRAAPRRGCACRGCRRRACASRPTVSAMPRALRSSSTCMRGLQTTQAAGKAAVGIGVHHHFLGLVHSHPAVQPAGKGGPEVLQGACGGGGGDGYDALLAEAQRVGQRGPQGGRTGRIT